MSEKHILVSLGDDKVREIGEVLGNKSCVLILDLLALEDLTVSDIAKKLKMPINTIDYNVKKLVRVGLIEGSSHWWSVKGKKMPVYRVSNRKIVISPKRSVSKVFAWVIGLTGLMALTIREFIGDVVNFGRSGDVVARDIMLSESPKMEALVMNAGASDAVIRGVNNVSFWNGFASWEWFLLGAWVAVFLFFIFAFVSERKSRSYYHEN
jgi:DNA-binding transcriptional ArsR family regulator